MLTTTDRFAFLDTSDPAAPVVAGEAVTPGSIDAYDAARVGDTVLFLQQNYGLAIADVSTLDVVARHEFGPAGTPQDRVFNDMQIDGNIAYLAAWGFRPHHCGRLGSTRSGRSRARAGGLCAHRGCRQRKRVHRQEHERAGVRDHRRRRSRQSEFRDQLRFDFLAGAARGT
jgi:hypothetical protein